MHSSGNVYVVDFGRQCILKFRSEVSPDDLEITTTSLPDGIEGQPYDQTLQAGGGVTPYTWSIASGNLPDGLSLYSGTGVISGTPTENGAFSFTVWVNDSQSPADTDTTLFDLHITPPDLEIMTTSLPGGVEGQAYSHTLEATGGVKPYNWNIVSGSLPDGLSLDASTGVIGGTATNAAIGISTFTVRVIDSQSTGDTIYIFGGLHDYLHLGPCLTSTEKYDSLSDTWMVVSPMNEARGNPGFATDDQGRIYAIAGWRMDGGVLSSVERYDMRRDLWEYVAPLPIRSGNPSAFTLNGEIYAVGGWKPGYTNECFIYSPDTDTWRGGPSMYEPVGVAGAVVASSGMPYLIGGQGPGIEARDRVSMLVDEDSELVWEATTSLQSLRVSPGVTLGLDGFIYALGGATGTTTGSAVNTVERFDEGTQTWSYIEPMTRRRMELEAVTDSLGRIWSVGGTDGDVGLDSVECYDPATGSWTMMTSHLNTGRGGHGIAIVSRKRQTDEEELSITIRPQRPIVTKEGDVVTVTWGDFGDGYYRVEWTDDLVSGIWQTPVGTWPISDLMWMDIVSNDVMQRFYRVESGGLYTDPVGFVKVVTVQGGFTMLSVPLLPADNRLNGDSGCIGDMIAAVLTGGPSADEADMIWRWDPDSENYGRVYLISGRGEGYDGKWWDDERGDFSTMTLDVGECCWILRRARQ